MKYKTRITKLTVMPENDPIFSEMATNIEIQAAVNRMIEEIERHRRKE